MGKGVGELTVAASEEGGRQSEIHRVLAKTKRKEEEIHTENKETERTCSSC